jgi:hypothetical protein
VVCVLLVCSGPGQGACHDSRVSHG